MGKANFNYKKRLIGEEPLDSRVEKIIDRAAAKVLPTLRDDRRGIVLNVHIKKLVYNEERDCMTRVAEWCILYGKSLNFFRVKKKPFGEIGSGKYGWIPISPLATFCKNKLSVSNEEWVICIDGHTTSLLEWRPGQIGDVDLYYKKLRSREEREQDEKQCTDFVMLFGKILSSDIIASNEFAISEHRDYFFYDKDTDTLRCAEETNDALHEIKKALSGLSTHQYSH